MAAKIALSKLEWQDKYGHSEKRTYRCVCGKWHLTSKPERKPNARTSVRA